VPEEVEAERAVGAGRASGDHLDLSVGFLGYLDGPKESIIQRSIRDGRIPIPRAIAKFWKMKNKNASQFGSSHLSREVVKRFPYHDQAKSVSCRFLLLF